MNVRWSIVWHNCSPTCMCRVPKAGEQLCFYLPPLPQLEEQRGSYDEVAIAQSVQQLQRQPPLPPQDIIDATLKRGQALVVEIGDTGTIHQIWVTQ